MTLVHLSGTLGGTLAVPYERPRVLALALFPPEAAEFPAIGDPLETRLIPFFCLNRANQVLLLEAGIILDTNVPGLFPDSL